jgi:hypothetical protein
MQLIVNRLLYKVQYTSLIHIKVLAILTESVRYTETKDYSFFCDLLQNFTFMQGLNIRKFVSMVTVMTVINLTLTRPCTYTYELYNP